MSSIKSHEHPQTKSCGERVGICLLDGAGMAGVRGLGGKRGGEY